MYSLVNKQTGEIITIMPEPVDCWHVREGIAEWQEYQPPVPTKDQLLAQLDSKYQPQFQDLQQAWAAAQLDGNTTLAAELQAEYQALKAEYQTAREGILNG